MLSKSCPSEIIYTILSYLFQDSCKYESDTKGFINKHIYHTFFGCCKSHQYIPIKHDKAIYKENTLKVLQSCTFHGKTYLNELIVNLQKMKQMKKKHGFPFRIDFSNEFTCKMSVKYISEYGMVSHFCNENKSVVIHSYEDILSSFI